MRLPPPHEVRATFSGLLADDPEKAVAYLHGLGIAGGYIDTGAVSRNIRWTAASPYGEWECTINLSKPEKDPRAIAADAARAPSASPNSPGRRLPPCDLCWENEGFPGAPGRPAKPGLRIAAIELGGECWGLQYSPYAYFAEHCIALSREHRPMKIDEPCFGRLLDFVDAFPFYFVGANADLPIVGGSILSHDHFQGGRHEFALMRAPIERTVPLGGLPQVGCGVVRWPASVLRLRSDDRAALKEAAARILEAWRAYSDERCAIVAATDAQHNTLNPTVRRAGAAYIMDLVLRNNRTDAEHPWGIFHAREDAHHIKRENIGLIEIMGLAILPPRLATELPLVQSVLADAARRGLPSSEVQARLEEEAATSPHAAWAAGVYGRRAAELARAGTGGPADRGTGAGRRGRHGSPAAPGERLHPVIQEEVARVFMSILEDTGVFKRDARGAAGWDSFIGRFA